MIDVTEICESFDNISEEILCSYSVGTGKKLEGEIHLLSLEIDEPKVKELSLFPALSMDVCIYLFINYLFSAICQTLF